MAKIHSSSKKKATVAGVTVAILIALYGLLRPTIHDATGWNLPAIAQTQSDRATEPAPRSLPSQESGETTRSDTVSGERESSPPASSLGESARERGPLADAMVQPRANDSEPAGSPALRYGFLREVSPERYISPAGLLYTPGSAEGHRLEHLRRHTEDQASRPGKHGVFDGGMEGALRTIDEAYENANAPPSVAKTVGRFTRWILAAGSVLSVGVKASKRTSRWPAASNSSSMGTASLLPTRYELTDTSRLPITEHFTSTIEDPEHVTRLEPDPADSVESLREESAKTMTTSVRLCVGKCPICDDGLCTVRSYFDEQHQLSYGLVVCDECEAIWLQPNTRGPHVFPDPESPHSPIGGGSLYDSRHSRWATRADVDALGWADGIDPTLTHAAPSAESVTDPTSLEECDELLDGMLAQDVDPVQAGLALKKLVDDDRMDGARLVAMLAAASDRIADADPAVLGGLLRLIHTRVLRAQAAGNDDQLTGLPVASLVTILSSLSPQVSNRHLLLQLLAMMRTPESLRSLVRALSDSPPRGWMAAGQILSPLMQHDDWPIDSLYPGLLDCLSEPSLAAPILDLAGYLVRSGRVDKNEHPSKNRIAALNTLLSQVSDRLGKFEEDPRSFGTDVEEVQAILGEAVALAVSLCDAVGLIGDESSIAPLNKAAQLRHRRVQCEAAGALARFGDAAGIEQLVSLAAEPSARLRAIAYADELGIGEKIDESLRTPEASAQAEVALWLSQPLHMGVPPTSVEVVDARRLLWPSFHDPVDVFLVRYQYDFGERSYSNIALAGPTVFSLSADVADLPPEDIYAIYAGWHAEHEDIFTVPASEFNESQRRLIEPLQTYLMRHDYEDIQPALLGFFLEETAAVFTASRGGVACVVVTDGLETMDLPTAGRLRPVSPTDLFHLYKGRKMLRTFNPQGIE